MIPLNEQNRNDIYDFLTDGMKERKEVFNPETGRVEIENVFNPRIAWDKSHMVNQPLGRHELYRQVFEWLATEVFDFMYYDRALQISRGIMAYCAAYDRSIDAKSSETYRDKRNTQASLLHLLAKRGSEKKLTLKGDEAKSGIAKTFGLGGRDDEEE